MTAKPANGSHHLVYAVLWLVFAVTLATLLLLGGKSSAETRQTKTSRVNRKKNGVATLVTHSEPRITSCT